MSAPALLQLTMLARDLGIHRTQRYAGGCDDLDPRRDPECVDPWAWLTDGLEQMVTGRGPPGDVHVRANEQASHFRDFAHRGPMSKEILIFPTDDIGADRDAACSHPWPLMPVKSEKQPLPARSSVET